MWQLSSGKHLFYLALTTLTSAQAPGDGAARCIVNHDSDYERTLMDSYSYVNLLPGNGTGEVLDDAVWNDKSFDGNDVVQISNPTYWQQGAGGICRFQVRVCGYKQEGALQNNWLFTQHISKDFDPNTYNYPVNIQVEITYTGMSCRSRTGCNPNFSILTYITNSVQFPSTEGNGFMNRNNYVNNVTITSSRRTSTSYFDFILKPHQTGLYIAIQDYGTCLSISRLRVYRNNCKAFQSGLVVYPDVPAPVEHSAYINISCVSNAAVVGSSEVTCLSDGTWGQESPVCHCNLGYENRDTECIACHAGMYQSDDGTCRFCPDNTVMDLVAATQCDCLPGYFRDDIDLSDNAIVDQGLGGDGSETADDGCTQPPSAPQSLSLYPTESSIFVTWSRPSDEGGRTDLYYQVEHSDPDNFGLYNDTVYHSSLTQRVTFSGLRPYTQYCVRVISQNGVSDQDYDRTFIRTVEECVRTNEGLPSAVTDLQGTYHYIIWNTPDHPNGVITMYRLTFTQSGSSVVITIPNAQTFYIIKPSDIPWMSGAFLVKVAAGNSVGFGATSQFTIQD